MKKIKHKLLSTFLTMLALVGSFLFSPNDIFAGTNLVVDCPDNASVCSTTPTNTPLFDETNMLPGDSFAQTLTINNLDSDESCNINLNAIDRTSGQPVNIAQEMYGAIYSGSTTYFGAHIGGQVVETQTYQNLYDTGTISLGTLAPSSSLVVDWLALFTTSAGNEYQGVNTIFDFDLNITCGSEPALASDGGDDGGGGSVAGASTPVCEDSIPTSAPILSLVSTGQNTASFSWNPVSPVTHYAIVFTRDSDGEQYGSTNIGNVTTYTVTNLSGGESYTFEVFGINDCAPGDRSNQVSTGLVAGGFIAGRPEGPGGEVLGEVTDKELKEGVEGEGDAGAILGDSLASCVEWKLYLPWIMLIIQALLTLISEYKFRDNDHNMRFYLAAGFTLLSIGLFYWLRECQCYGDGSWLVWLCKWYWVVSLLLTGLIKVFSYSVIVEVDGKK